MQRVDEPLETIHLYVVREEEPRPSLLPVVLSMLVLLALLAIGILIPYKPLYVQKTIRVPAILLPLQSFSTTVTIIPTGEKTYPATQAHGTLTITNGSILSQELPKGMILTGKDGMEVTTDTAVFIPAGSVTGYGVAFVSAHATASGKNGNTPALDIDTVEGTSIYIRNLHSFTGGQDAYTVRFLTSQDRQNALFQARATLTQQTLTGMLSHPCSERITGTTSLFVTWTCQFITYTTPSFPGVRVLHAHVSGKTVVLEIAYLPRPQKFETK
jgi:Baseplate J-like protein